MTIFRYLIFIMLSFIHNTGCAQSVPENRPHCQNPAFDRTVAGLLNFSVPVIGVEELENIQNEVVIFDAREMEEYETSHLPGAGYLGYPDFDAGRLVNLPKDTMIVVYCSVGYRSEKIGEKLQQLGYRKVYNLYGSLFEWANRGKPLIDAQGNETRTVHTFNKKWSQWVEDDKAKKKW
jgi:rhodanese-related sulfurtransferase